MKRLSYFIKTSIIVLLLFPAMVQAKSFNPILWNYQELSKNANSSQWVKTKVAKADEALRGELLKVTDKQKTISGDIHNYESLAYYAWPDPNNPNGPYIERDGQPSPEYKYYDGERLTTLNKRFIALGEAYYLTHDDRYAERMKEQLRVWFVDMDTRMNPNFTHGQFIPGRRNGKGHTGAISEAYFFMNILECVALMEQNNAMDKKLNKKLKAWFKSLSSWLRESELGHEMHDVKDNHAIMYDVLLYRISMFVGDKQTRKQIISEFPALRLSKHIAKDGSQPLELKRTKAMMYSIYNLQHIADLCVMAESDGYHLYRNNSSLINSALDFINTYIEKPSSFPYKEIGDWKLYKGQFTNVQNQLRNLQ